MGRRKSFLFITILSVVITIVVSCRFYFNTTKDTFTAKPDNNSLERGKNLAFNSISRLLKSELAVSIVQEKNHP